MSPKGHKTKIVMLEGTTMLNNGDLAEYFKRLLESTTDDSKIIFGDFFKLTQKPRVQVAQSPKVK